jgi:uncharacterized protein YbjT (DUF2867 family)
VRIFLAGATGVIGIRLVPLLVAAGHEVVGMTRSPGKVAHLRELGAKPVVRDVYDAEALREAVVAAGPDAVIHQLTDLPDDPARIKEVLAANTLMWRDGTRNLLAAARAAGATRFLAQSVAWQQQSEGRAASEAHERAVLEAGGVVVRYGRFYGPGTYFETDAPAPPRVHVDEAARRTVALLDASSGIVVVAEDEEAA